MFLATRSEFTRSAAADAVRPALESVEARLTDARSAIADLASDWSSLAEQASEPNSYSEPWFVAASLATLENGRDLRLAQVRRAGKLIGVMPLSIERDYGRIRIPFVQNWCHHQLFLGTPLVRRGEEKTFWLALLDLLDRSSWAPNFLHLRGLTEHGPVHRGLVAAARESRRGCASVHRESRALLETDLGPDAYYVQAVRAKKRKDIRRLQARLAELGTVRARRLEEESELECWCSAFLALEMRGWKGKAGSALACAPETEAFFRAAVRAAWAEGRLDFLRLDLDGREIAMLVNFLAPPGSFAFKTCFDEDYSRFSPGVLIQVDNLRILDRPGIRWTDSCAVENHPMIDSFWIERRPIVRVTVGLKGARRRMVHFVCRILETGSAGLRTLSRRRDQ